MPKKERRWRRGGSSKKRRRCVESARQFDLFELKVSAGRACRPFRDADIASVGFEVERGHSSGRAQGLYLSGTARKALINAISLLAIPLPLAAGLAPNLSSVRESSLYWASVNLSKMPE